MTSKGEGKDFWRYTWDYENRLTEASTRKQKVRYRYDALGRRVSRNLGYSKDSTKFTYDGFDVLVDDRAGALTKYLNGTGIDDKLRQTNGSSTDYFLSDQLGSTNGLTDGAGALTAVNSYDSFGNPANASFPTRYQFTGREYDGFSGLQYSRARWYDPKIGRFISEDPIGFLGGDVNLYGYVWNNPQNFTDPSGRFPFLVPYSNGGELADAIDRGLNSAENQCSCNLPVVGFGMLGIGPKIGPFDLVRGASDLLRVGRGFGQAIYETDLPDYRRFELGSQDIVRGGSIFLALAGPFAGSGSGAVINSPPNPFGRLGSPAHQAIVDNVILDVESRGLTAVREFHIPTPGGSKCRRFADVAGLDSNGLPAEFHQVGRQTKGGLPVARERMAMDDIVGATGIRPQFWPF